MDQTKMVGCSHHLMTYWWMADCLALGKFSEYSIIPCSRLEATEPFFFGTRDVRRRHEAQTQSF
jgi:hypothetical protein